MQENRIRHHQHIQHPTNKHRDKKMKIRLRGVLELRCEKMKYISDWNIFRAIWWWYFSHSHDDRRFAHLHFFTSSLVLHLTLDKSHDHQKSEERMRITFRESTRLWLYIRNKKSSRRTQQRGESTNHLNWSHNSRTYIVDSSVVVIVREKKVWKEKKKYFQYLL